MKNSAEFQKFKVTKHFDFDIGVNKNYFNKTIRGDKKSTIQTLAILANGTLISGNNIGKIKFWDMQSGKCTQVIIAHSSIAALAVLQNGILVSAGSENTGMFIWNSNRWEGVIKFWDCTSGKCIKTLKDQERISTLVVLDNGNLVSGGGEGVIKLRDPKSGECIKTLVKNSSSSSSPLKSDVTALVVLPDGTLVSGHYDSSIHLWDLQNGTCIKTLTGHTEKVSALAVSPDGMLVSAAETIKFWQPKSGECVQTLKEGSIVRNLAFLSDGTLVSRGYEFTRCWDVATEKPLNYIKSKEAKISTLIIFNDTLISGGSDLRSSEEYILLFRFPELKIQEKEFKNDKQEFIAATAPASAVALSSSQFTKLQSLFPEVNVLLLQYNQQSNADKKYVTEMQDYIQRGLKYYTPQSSVTEIEQAITTLISHQQNLKSLTTVTNKSSETSSIKPHEVNVESTEMKVSTPEIKSALQVKAYESSKIFSGENPKKPLATLEISFSIPRNELIFEKEIGQGGFGIVFKGKWQHTDVAIKQLQAKQLSEKALEEFQSEMKIMASLNYPNIVRLFGITDSIPYCMVMEYLPKGDLFNLLHSKEQLNAEQTAKIALDIARGLAYLHQKKTLHRDLKSKNILLDKELQAKVADFGLAKVRTETATSSTGKIVGTLGWMAPEIILGEIYSLKADIYSFGVILWELSAREVPFAKANGNQVLIAAWKSMGKKDEIPKDTPTKLAKLIEASWAQKPEDRPSAEQAVQQLQTTTTVTSPTPKSTEYRSNFDSTSMDSGYRGDFDSDNNSFRP